MPHYIIPDKGDFEEVADKCKLAGVSFIMPKTVRDYILSAHEHTVCVFAVSARDVLIFNRFASTLLAEPPTVVTGAPGPLYNSDWMTASAAHFTMSWDEFSKQLSKSGLVSSTTDQLESRGRGIPSTELEPSALDQLRSRHAKRDDPVTEDLVDSSDAG
jgi:hypothetical protein